MRLIIIWSILLLLIACKATNKQPRVAPNPIEKAQKNVPNSATTEVVLKTTKVDENISITPHHYICYIDDNKPDRKIWISFTEEGRAIQIKYLGQTEAIDLVYVKEEYLEGGAHPTIKEYYNEIYEGQINGQYKLEHSGAWDYAAYVRGKDAKKFNFTIDTNADQYTPEPCF